MTKLAELEHRLEAEVHRKDFWLRIIILLKFVKAALLISLSITAFALAHSDLRAYAFDLVSWLGIDPAGPRVGHFLAGISGLTPHRVQAIGAGAAVMACVMAIEGWGLHRRRIWAEWLTIIVTTSLVPIEVYELIAHASLGKVLALGANVLIVIYLLRHRNLFVLGRFGRWLRAKLSRAR
jgi:uncharacterized membrane protein (DUF2068 family)